MVTGNERPTLRELMKHVISQYAVYWDRIGIELGVNIRIIERDYRQDSVTCFMKTLQEWLDSTPHATWKMLEVAVNRVLKAGDYSYGIDSYS